MWEIVHQVEHVLASQTLIQKKAKNFKVEIVGTLTDSISAKDLALSVIGAIGTAGGTGYVIEYMGNAVESLSMEGRMTLCNLTIEAGARAGLIALDLTRNPTMSTTRKILATSHCSVMAHMNRLSILSVYRSPGVLYWSFDFIGSNFRAACFLSETKFGLLLLALPSITYLLFVSFHLDQILHTPRFPEIDLNLRRS